MNIQTNANEIGFTVGELSVIIECVKFDDRDVVHIYLYDKDGRILTTLPAIRNMCSRDETVETIMSDYLQIIKYREVTQS